MAGIYIHIPFCKTRCIYCDFFSSTSMQKKEDYIHALCREIELRKDYLEEQSIDTIYFGGGTPSQLSAADLEKILNTLSGRQTASGGTNPIAAKEITIEANPDDITEEYLSMIIRHFNRISIGIQSFQDKDLRFLNRRHSASQAIEAVKNCQEAGFKNISIDLMYGLPEQTLDEWKENLKTALSLGVQHISAYHLIYEEDTALYKLLEQNKVQEADEELSVKFFSEMIDVLTGAGFIHYETSNFALPGYISKHNFSYWTGEHYLGIGASAHSFNGISRQWNIDSIEQYIQQINENIIPAETEIINETTAYNDYVLTGLRTRQGINLQVIESRFGEIRRRYCEQQAQKHINNDTLLLEEGVLKISSKGMFLSDGIMSDLMFVP